MAWIEIHQSLFTHRKTVVLAAELGTDLDAAAIKLIRLWAWCLDNAPEGDLSGLSPEVIAFGAQWNDDAQRFVDALMTAGYLNPDHTLHHWWDYAGKLIEQRRANAAWGRARREIAATVFGRDGYRCRYCGTTENLTLDHIVPRAHGGHHEEFNLVTACRPCNSRKGARTPLQAGMFPRVVGT